jgi:hypothetical protein
MIRLPTHSLAPLSPGSLSRAALSKHIFARSADLERWGRPSRPPAPVDIDISALSQDLQAILFRYAPHSISDLHHPQQFLTPLLAAATAAPCTQDACTSLRCCPCPATLSPPTPLAPALRLMLQSSCTPHSCPGMPFLASSAPPPPYTLTPPSAPPPYSPPPTPAQGCKLQPRQLRRPPLPPFNSPQLPPTSLPHTPFRSTRWRLTFPSPTSTNSVPLHPRAATACACLQTRALLPS